MYQVTNLFQNAYWEKCPITSYRAYDLEMKEVENSDLVKFENNILIINLTVKGKLDFHIIASTDSKVTAKILYEVEIIQSDPYDKFLLDVVNTFPTFSEPLGSPINISLVEELDGTLEDDTIFEYKSPKLVDSQNHGIVLEVDRGRHSFINTKQNDDDTLSIFVDRSSVPRKDAIYSLSIRIGDSLGSFSDTLQNIDIKVTYTSKIAEAEEKEREKMAEEEELKKPKDAVVEQGSAQQLSPDEDLANILLDPFPEASTMSDEELDDEVFLADEEVEGEILPGLGSSEDIDESLETSEDSSI